jgi:hypothetical protein
MSGSRRDERSSRLERGYGADHDKERRRWRPIVAAGGAQCANPICLRSNRLIHPSEPWDLGHNEDRSGWRGPEHRECNRSEGGRNGAVGNRARNQMTIRNWGER